MTEAVAQPTGPATPPLPSVADLVASTLDALFITAALHLGEPLADGVPAIERRGIEAYLALVTIDALLAQWRPLMAESALALYDARFAELLGRLAEQYPDEPFPLPGLVVAAEEAAPRPNPAPFTQPPPPRRSANTGKLPGAHRPANTRDLPG